MSFVTNLLGIENEGPPLEKYSGGGQNLTAWPIFLGRASADQIKYLYGVKTGGDPRSGRR